MFGEAESPRAVGGRGSGELADRVVDLDGCARHHRARWIGNHAA